MTSEDMDTPAVANGQEEPLDPRGSYRHYVFLGLILLLGLILRLYEINRPPVDFLNWRETQTLMVTRNFYREGLMLFTPAIDWRTTSEVAPRGTVGATELMVTPFLTAILYHVFGMKTWVDRVIPILFSLIGAAYFHRLVNRFYGPATATISTLLLTVSPYFLFCGRCHMPEAFAFAMSFATLYHYARWLSTEEKEDFTLAALFALLMMLGKPQMAITIIPMALLSIQKFGWPFIIEKRLYLFAALVGLPCALYVWWSYGVLPGKAGLTYGNTQIFEYRRWLTDPAYYAMIGKAIWFWALTPAVCLLALAGLFLPALPGLPALPRLPRLSGRAEGRFFAHAWGVGALAFFLLLPGGNAANGYYHMVLAPPAVIFAALALERCFRHKWLRLPAWPVLAATVVYCLYIVSILFEPRHESDYACGKWIAENTPEDALVLTSTASPATLYFSDRVGWTPWTEGYGKGASFNRDFLMKVGPLGASVLAVPIPHSVFDNAYYPEYQDIRDDLYETYAFYKEEAFTVFSLTNKADLSLPKNGYIDFGTLESRKYLRGHWGPNQEDRAGKFVALGPAKQALIRFASHDTPSKTFITFSSAVAGQRYTVAWNQGTAVTGRIHNKGQIVTAVLPAPLEPSPDGLYTIVLEGTEQNENKASLMLYSMNVR